MRQYRVTKYDPKRREASERYEIDEWSCVSDIGQLFESGELTAERYLTTENGYVTTALAFLVEAGIESLKIDSLENPSGYQASNITLREGHLCSLLETSDICRAVLRSLLWCRLVHKDGYVHFGYDYYMYLGVRPPTPNANRHAVAAGLFVEEHESPYHDAIK